MNDFIEQLKHQEKLHRKSGANGLADLFMNAAEELDNQCKVINELEKELSQAIDIIESSGVDYNEVYEMMNMKDNDG